MRANAEKYQQLNSNPLTRILLNHFFRSLIKSFPSDVSSMLDAGCGEGHALARLDDIVPDKLIGIDVDKDAVKTARDRFPAYNFKTCSVYDLPFNDNRFELITCLEVLEHLREPVIALRELERVASKWILISVPFEPVFQLGNLCRGKNIIRLGNHPDHVQHWWPKTFVELVERETDLKYDKLSCPLPWFITRWEVTN
jgi:ubiquinone/menaquinone biosynthesis C-methylase UbiE